jgi:hypothetical protein
MEHRVPRYMVDRDRQIESLMFVARKTHREARRVAIRLIATSLVPFSSIHITLKARHAALLKIVDELHAEIERLRMIDSASAVAASEGVHLIWRDAPRSTLEVG